MISERFYATCSTTEPCNCFQTPDKPLSGAPILSSFRLLACLQNKNVFSLQSLKSSLQKRQLVCGRNIFSFHQKTNAASCCVPRMVVRVSMVWRGKMWQCHLVNQWVSILQQADAFQLFPRQAELSFQGCTAAPMHLPAPHTHSSWACSWSMSCGYGTSLRMSYPEQKSQTQPCKPRRRQLARVGGGPCRNQSHSPPADVTGPWDLSFTSHPGSSGLPWHLVLLCLLSPGARHCYMCWQFYPLPCPCTVSLRGQKAISQTALLCLLTEGSYGLTVPFQRKKKSQQTVYLQLLLQTLSSSATHSTPKTKPESWGSVHNSRVLRIIKGDILLLYSRQRISGLHQIWETFPFILTKEVRPDPERFLPPTSHQNQHPIGTCMLPWPQRGSHSLSHWCGSPFAIKPQPGWDEEQHMETPSVCAEM